MSYGYRTTLPESRQTVSVYLTVRTKVSVCLTVIGLHCLNQDRQYLHVLHGELTVPVRTKVSLCLTVIGLHCLNQDRQYLYVLRLNAPVPSASWRDRRGGLSPTAPPSSASRRKPVENQSHDAVSKHRLAAYFI